MTMTFLKNPGQLFYRMSFSQVDLMLGFRSNVLVGQLYEMLSPSLVSCQEASNVAFILVI